MNRWIPSLPEWVKESARNLADSSRAGSKGTRRRFIAGVAILLIVSSIVAVIN